MKTKLTCLGLVLSASAFLTFAATPTYKSLVGAGKGKTTSNVIFPADAGNQIRLVNVAWQADTNTSTLSFSTGAGAYVTLSTNVSTAISNFVNSTVGLITNSTLIFQQGGNCYLTTLVATNNTNLIWWNPAIGVDLQKDCEIYVMGTPSTVLVGNTTNSYNGEAIFVGEAGRPVRIELTPVLTTNKITSATARYE